MFLNRRDILWILVKSGIGSIFFSGIHSQDLIAFAEGQQLQLSKDTYFRKLKNSLLEVYKERTVYLVSSQGIDYSNLRYLLSSADFSLADQETKRIILELCDGSSSWEKIIPCEDLIIINTLWIKYSNENILERITGGFGRYGFGFIYPPDLEERCRECNVSL